MDSRFRGNDGHTYLLYPMLGFHPSLHSPVRLSKTDINISILLIGRCGPGTLSFLHALELKRCTGRSILRTKQGQVAAPLHGRFRVPA